MAASRGLASVLTLSALCREVRCGPTASSSSDRLSSPIGLSRPLEGRETEGGPEIAAARAKGRKGGRAEAATTRSRSGTTVARVITT